ISVGHITDRSRPLGLRVCYFYLQSKEVETAHDLAVSRVYESLAPNFQPSRKVKFFGLLPFVGRNEHESHWNDGPDHRSAAFLRTDRRLPVFDRHGLFAEMFVR